MTKIWVNVFVNLEVNRINHKETRCHICKSAHEQHQTHCLYERSFSEGGSMSRRWIVEVFDDGASVLNISMKPGGDMSCWGDAARQGGDTNMNAVKQKLRVKCAAAVSLQNRDLGDLFSSKRIKQRAKSTEEWLKTNINVLEWPHHASSQSRICGRTRTLESWNTTEWTAVFWLDSWWWHFCQ